jgi:hypothetical protein
VTLLDEYPKIDSIYMRDQRGRFIDGEWSCPEFAFLASLPWVWTEKVNGTNIRLGYEWNGFRGNEHVYVAGRTNEAQIPPQLLTHLIALLKTMPLEQVFTDPNVQVTLYGEGYGAKIHKGGGNYIPDGCDFVLFDVKIGTWWLRREAVEDVASKLGLRVVPIVFEGPIEAAINVVKQGFISAWPGVSVPEGLVGRPAVDLFNRKGERIITKIKHRDFR